MDLPAAIGVGLLGIPVGSFLNVVIDRVPDRAALRGPREGEACPPLTVAGVPAQPWLLRAGRTPAGGEGRLPTRWLWVELVTALLWGMLTGRFGAGTTVVPLLVLAASLVAVSVIDLQLLRIPDLVTFPTLALSVPLVLAVTLHEGTDAFGGALVGAVSYFVLLLVPHLVYPRGMGFGDVKLALVMGLFLGWLGWTAEHPFVGPLQLVLYGLMLGCALGVLFGVVSSIVTRRRGEFPFGPALALGCLLVVLWAPDLRLV